MPTHFHAIVGAADGEQLSSVMRDLKRFTSREIVNVLQATGEELPLRAFKKAASLQGRGNDHKVWKDEFHPIGIRSIEVFRQKLDYIHHNPVRKGLVEESSHWRYSSAGFYDKGSVGVLEMDELEW